MARRLADYINNKTKASSSLPGLELIEKYRAESLIASQQHFRQEQIQAGLCQVPPRFLGKTFVDFSVTSIEQQQMKKFLSGYVVTFAERKCDGTCLIFVGKPGTGKTMIALIMLQQLIHAGYCVLYYSSLHFLRALHEKEFKSSAAFANEMAALKKMDLLIIDEVTESSGRGCEPMDWERNMLRTLIDVRYQHKLCTIVISNRSAQEVIQRLGEPTVDRLTENGAVLGFNWHSYRQK